MTTRHRELWERLVRLPAWSDVFEVEVPAESSTTVELLRALTGVHWWHSQASALHGRLDGLLSSY